MSAMSVPSFRAGVEIGGRFHLAKPLATGGMAQAFLAWDAADRRPVVVKHPRRGLLDDDLFRARFHREIEALRSLHHAHIVPLITTGTHDDVPYLVMPFMAGGSLAERLSRPQGRSQNLCPPSSLRQWLPAIAESLDYAHAHGVVHRDVKPANVFFDAYRGPFLGDFGIVKPLEEAFAEDDSLTRTNVALGTLLYMAPERFKTGAQPSGLSDQYSLAVCVYEALAGRRPFLGQTHHVAVEHMTILPPPLPVHPVEPASESLHKALERALAKEPAHRFGTCAEFAAAILSEVPVPPASEAVAELMCPACRRVILLKPELQGLKGHCSRCQAPIAIGPRCEWLWPADLAVHRVTSAAVPAGSSAMSAAAAPRTRFNRRRLVTAAWMSMALGGLIAAIAGREPPPPKGSVVAEPAQHGDMSSPPFAALAAFDAAASPPRGREEPPAAPPPTEAAAVLGDDGTTAVPEAKEPTTAAEPAQKEAADDAMPENAPPAEPLDASVPAEAEDEVAQEPDRPVRRPDDEAVADGAGSAPPPAFPNQAVLDIAWVPIDDPGNASDANGRGTVDHPFLIGRYEVTNAEYCAFLNGSDAGRRNHGGVADGPSRPDDPNSPEDYDRGILRLKDPERDDYRYQVVPRMHDKPVVNLCWSDAARYANWLHNGGCVGADTEHGAYELTGVGREESEARPALPQARVWVPTLDEWYKAAFSKVADGKCIGYWKFPTASDDPPTGVKADEFGTCIASVKPGGNHANFTNASRWPVVPQGGIKSAVWRDVGSVTSVGSNGKPGDFGAYDMAGNAAELVALWTSPTALAVVIVGGDTHGKAKASSLSSDGISDRLASSSARRTAGLRLACTATAAIPIGPAREIRPLGEIDKAIEAAENAFTCIVETPVGRVSLLDTDARMKALKRHAPRKTASSKLPAEAAFMLQQAQTLLDTILKESSNRTVAQDMVHALSQAYPLRVVMGPKVVDQLGAFDRTNLDHQFRDSYEKHQETAKTLIKTCKALRRALEDTPPSPQAPQHGPPR